MADPFFEDLSGLFNRLQDMFCSLPEVERRKCGKSGTATDISIKVDMEKKEISLDRIYKYCDIEIRLFKEIVKILQQNFPEFTLVIPALKGYQLAKEIRRYLGDAKVEWIHLKSRTDERLLMGQQLSGITFEGILKDTEGYYTNRGDIENVMTETRNGSEISMYHEDEAGEEEVLWMQVRVPLSGILTNESGSNMPYVLSR